MIPDSSIDTVRNDTRERVTPQVGNSHTGSGYAKRVLDVIGASIMLLVAAPLLLLLTVMVKMVDGGPGLYRQERVGYRGKRFSLVKLRSMLVDAEQIIRNDPLLYELYLREYKTEDSAVVTRLGRILRATYLDELPQLLNVIRGDMSLVGPRPVIPDELRAFGDLAPVILSVRPGMTGLWQIHREIAPTYAERAQMEAWYACNWSLAEDAVILAQTVLHIFGSIAGMIARKCRGKSICS